MANPKKETYQVFTTWVVDATVEVEAWSAEDAMQKVRDMGDLPDNPSYVDDSFDVCDAQPAKQPERERASVRSIKDLTYEAPVYGNAEQEPGKRADGSRSSADILREWGFGDMKAVPETLEKAVETMLDISNKEQAAEKEKNARI